MTLQTEIPALRTISVIAPSDQLRGVSIITAGFVSDPVVRWVYPDIDDYFTYFPRFVEGFAGSAFHDGTAYGAEDGQGAALWLAPGVHSDENALGALIEESLSGTKLDEVYGFIEKQAEAHPTMAHWYLPLIAVDPVAQGRGIGSALLQHALKVCDRERLPAYLEATSVGSRRLYERHDFEAVGEIQFGSSPPMWPMLRQPR